MINTNRLPRRLSGSLLVALLLAGIPAAQGIAYAAPATPVAAAPQTTFPSAEAAVDALVAALGRHDNSGFRALMGPGGEKLLESGDKIADENARQRFLADYAAHHQIATQSDGRAILIVGTNDWPLPIPIVQANGSWHFDAAAGAQEIINRRIGRNEIAAIRTSLAFVDGEQAYHDRFGTYAMRLFSSPDKYDGLYWEPGPGEPESPLGPLVAQAVDEGYPGASAAGKALPYQGYYFRILKGQGSSAPGGRKAYVANGEMTGGYALLAWPATYGVSGITTFQVNQDGTVFQKDLGPDTAKIVAGMSLYDPDITWARVDITP
jgi:hypothetical protein